MNNNSLSLELGPINRLIVYDTYNRLSSTTIGSSKTTILLIYVTDQSDLHTQKTRIFKLVCFGSPRVHSVTARS